MQIDEKPDRSDSLYGLCCHYMNNLVNFDTNDNAIVILISEIIVSLMEIPIHSLRPKTLHLDG